MVANTESEFQHYFERRHHRTYAQVSEGTGLVLLPDLSSISLPRTSKVLMHVATHGKPHCVAVELLDGEVQVTDGAVQRTVSEKDFTLFRKLAVDSKYILFFEVYRNKHEMPAEGSNADDSLTAREIESLLDFQAAGQEDGECDDFVVDVDQDAVDDDSLSEQDEDLQDSDDEAVVRVGDVLLGKLQREAGNCCVHQIVRTEENEYRCPFCPFRSFSCSQSTKRVLAHVKNYHNERKQYVASGTKQLKIIISLHDSDQCSRKSSENYLARSSEILRSTVQPALSSRRMLIDRHIRLVFTDRGLHCAEYEIYTTRTSSHKWSSKNSLCMRRRLECRKIQTSSFTGYGSVGSRA